VSPIHLLWLLPAYLLGAVPTSYLAARYAGGVDLRTFGSRNLGATNLYRLLGFRWAVPVALFDVLKGTIPTLLASSMRPAPAWWPLLMGAAAVAGHVFSPFVGFKGGKGVATAAGVTLALVPGAFVGAALVWAAVLRLTGYVSLGSILAALAFPLLLLLMYPSRQEWLGMALVLALFIVFTHRANIRRLLDGTEHRFGRPKAEQP
jgi:glycerol-3-phosphate acyltransferase PlsY